MITTCSGSGNGQVPLALDPSGRGVGVGDGLGVGVGSRDSVYVNVFEPMYNPLMLHQHCTFISFDVSLGSIYNALPSNVVNSQLLPVISQLYAYLLLGSISTRNE